ncbi:MAG: carboxypeptidase regulatory-like domain-containing protein [Methanomassiliicoccales archaeon]|nr:carboxypeptidase regulatory-like domain-containing protein [Methanomassiliicoccales archaeon]
MHRKLPALLLISLFLVFSLSAHAAAGAPPAIGTGPTAAPMTGVVIDSPENGSHLNGLNITVSWHMTGSVAAIQFYLVSVDGGGWINNSLRTSISLIMPQEGAHSVRVQAWTEIEVVYSDMVIFFMDTIPPTVIDYQPIGTQVPVSAEIVVTFSEEMNKDSVIVTGVQGTSTWDGQTVTVTITPYEPLLLEHNYLLIVYGQDLAGNNLTWFSWSFSTTSQGSVTGQVVDDRGDLVADADVLLLHNNEVVAETKTDDNGRFQISAPAGSYNLTISKDSIIAKTVPVEITAGGALDIGVVQVQPAPDYEWVVIDAVIVVGALGLFFVGNRNQRLRRK